ncbi:MAG: hypothetical protein EBT06_02720 [Gammaproteobacteria bacterium]|nr:hypothetical protein [Gammaproteobacteria bacterium]NBT43831.1 hypothetical protein [Gammaproteobacteria bacterium]NBY23662.1 hypothetical protein [Gammaproteobacteria bacterium]NDE33326.1 hypothetical protein [Gammaproteobacteria bacterium]NDE55313.1 hypothetical protein [Gammaproteobacteria bacterium]
MTLLNLSRQGAERFNNTGEMGTSGTAFKPATRDVFLKKSFGSFWALLRPRARRYQRLLLTQAIG